MGKMQQLSMLSAMKSVSISDTEINRLRRWNTVGQALLISCSANRKAGSPASAAGFIKAFPLSTFRRGSEEILTISFFSKIDPEPRVIAFAMAIATTCADWLRKCASRGVNRRMES